MVYSRKIQTGVVEDILFWKKIKNKRPEFLEILEKISFQPWKVCKMVWHPLDLEIHKTKNQGQKGQKQRPMEINFLLYIKRY